MEYKYNNEASGTGLVKNAIPWIAAIAVSLIPSSNYEIPKQVSINYGDYSEFNTQSFINVKSQIDENGQSEVLFSFANKLAENTKDLDNDIAQIISNDFWEMYDRF